MPQAINNLLRLEVDASDVTNLINNPSGANNNTSGWAADSGTLASSTNTAGTSTALRLTPTPNAGAGYKTAYMYSNYIPVAAGDWVGLSVEREFSALTVNIDSRIGLVFEGSTGNTLSSVSSSSSYGSLAKNGKVSLRYQAPVGAVRVAVTVTHWDRSGLTGTPVYANYWQWMLVKGSTEAVVTDVPYSSGRIWQNMLGNAYSIKTSRGMDVDGVTDKPVVGSMSAVLSDPSFDPVNNPRMRPGRAVRLTAYNSTSQVYTPIWQGRIATLDNSYRDGKVRTSITATDAWAELANIPLARGYGGTYRQRIETTMNYSTIPYVVNDPAANVSSVVIDSQDSATAQDQLLWARNSMRGFVWLKNDNSLYATTGALMGTTPVATFSDKKADTSAVYFTDIDCNFGSQALVNQLMIDRHNVNETEDNGKKTYGPYTNTASAVSWGTRSATLEVNDGDPATLAAAALAVYATPSIFASGLKFNARQHLTQAIGLEVYSPVTVKFATASLNTVYRVLSIEHEITPDQWETALTFRPMESPATITVTNPSGGANTGPSDVTPPQPGILGSRYLSGNYTIAYATYVTVPLDGVDVADGITYDTTNNRFVIPRDGRYAVSAGFRMAGGAGVRAAKIAVNGNGMVETVAYSTEETAVVAKVLKLKAGDVVSLQGLQYVANPGTVYGSAPNRNTYMDITYIGT